MISRNEQKKNRRQQIIYEALNLFVSKGYAATKITDIATASNMSVGLLFHYFESKEALYEELIKIGLEGTKQPMQQKCDKAIDYFILFTKGLFSAMKTNPFTSKMFVFMDEALRNDDKPEFLQKMANHVTTIEEFVKIIEKGQQEGSIKDGNPLVLSNAFWCSISGISEQYARHPEIPLPEAEWVVDIIRK